MPLPISYLYAGQPMNGSAADGHVIAYKGSTGADNNTIDGNGGDDLVIADSSDTWIPECQSYLNGTIGTAFNLEAMSGTWTTAENPMFGDWTIPHTTVMAEATIGQSEILPGGRSAPDSRSGSTSTSLRTPRSALPRDLVVELRDSLGNIIATADDSLRH